ncbi:MULTISPECIES: magnesium chelatase ATPase subunit I [unclassified Roseitalea]|uniref:magnesium chelatase ATPase subunit I n=1 Tax=unclassified Roseitalea TaxID=2639107 RepID=UPI00273DC7D6|nr:MULTISPECIES: magnesium chelatase ATPase subunit I [unclassified Roseitalea]
MSAPFPFAAIVGQEEMKQALLMTAVDPLLGGVLVFGDRGTGKSTAIRALAALLPGIQTRPSCLYNCEPDRPVEICTVCNADTPGRPKKRPAPVVDLPLGATEDRVCGALDLERALIAGEKAFEPGLLARAHRGFLYIDEVNLLEDHLVDLLLDVAASGVNVVEREGLSVRHPARFVLIGSGNPEEGELRPQLLDRFGLAVDVASPGNLADRVEVVRRREAYERDRDGFVDTYKRKDAAVRRKIDKARGLIDDVSVPDDVLELASRICMALGVDGLRGELTLMRAARARAALAGRTETQKADIVAIAPMALRHRLRRDPLDEAGSAARVERAVGEVANGAAGHA